MPSDKTLSAIGINCAKAFISIIAISALRVGNKSGDIGDCNSVNCLSKMCEKITRVASLVISKKAVTLTCATIRPLFSRISMRGLVYPDSKMILAYSLI